ncbi:MULTISPECIES: hypothetical protein [unclassified Nonomuraea]|uniref:hypothetical protein n=1 Tax=unclassified Nonomuraea TaxID=2593643 RepID=UPI0033CD9193
MSYYDIEGNPISPARAQELLADRARRTIGDDRVGTAAGTFRIRTLHLVLDQADGGTVPLLFESTVRLSPPGADPGTGGQEVLSLHWSTRQQAEDAHAQLVRDITERQDLPSWAREGG